MEDWNREGEELIDGRAKAVKGGEKNRKAFIVVAPVLFLLVLGWIGTVIQFGRDHTENAGGSDAGTYALRFLSFWIYVLMVPATAILVFLHTYKGSKNNVLGLLSHSAESITAIALGGCLLFSVLELTADTDECYVYYNDTDVLQMIGVVGKLLSVLSLIALHGIVPFCIGKCCCGNSE